MRTTPDARLSIGLIGVSLASLGMFLWLGFRPLQPRDVQQQTRFTSRSPDEAGTEFANIADRVGLGEFRHDTAGLRSIEQVMAPGIGLLDLDRDEDLDLVLLGGPGHDPGVSVFLNQLQEGRFVFEDVTEQVGIRWRGAAQGICAGDYDNDNDIDLFVTAIGQNLLLANRLDLGLLRFDDVTEQASLASDQYHYEVGTAEVRNGPPPARSQTEDSEAPQYEGIQEFSTGCSFGDFDRDGFLDLFVANYVSLIPIAGRDAELKADREAPPEFRPSSFPSQPDHLYHNNGNGTFTEVDDAMGISDTDGRGLSAGFFDVNGDGYPEIFVCNEASPNAFYCNLYSKFGAYVEIAEVLGLDDTRSSRGLSLGDADNDGDLDLAATHYLNEATGLFMFSSQVATHTYRGATLEFSVLEDRAQDFGLALPSERFSGFGIAFFDYDNDGDQDCLSVNGDTSPAFATAHTCSAQKPLLLANDKGRFTNVSESAGEDFQELSVARGLAIGDVDGDEDLDIVFAQNNGPVVLLENRLARPENRCVELAFPTPGRQSPTPRGSRINWIGATVRIISESRTQQQQVVSGGSYLSQGPFRVHFGVGTAQTLSLTAQWQYPDVELVQQNDVTPEALKAGR